MNKTNNLKLASDNTVSSTEDWLTPMIDGTIFLTNWTASGSYHLQEFTVREHAKIAILLFRKGDYNHNNDCEEWVDPKKFCDLFYCFEILVKGEDIPT